MNLSLEYGLRSVIASHPNPQMLSLAWGMTLAGAADAHAAQEGLAFNSAMQQAMRSLTNVVALDRIEPN